MPIEIIRFEGDIYPAFQANGNALRFCLPFAQEVCKGRGVDVGCNRIEWSFPGSIPVDPLIDPAYNALHFPDDAKALDYIIASHSLEHFDRWVDVLDYWYTRLKSGGVLFLYLPSYEQRYHRPWSNRKHLNIFTPEIINDYLESKGYIKAMVSGVDLYHGFCAMAEK